MLKASPYTDRVAAFAGIDFSGVGPGWAEQALAQLEADVKAGAVGVGEIMKNLGSACGGGRFAACTSTIRLSIRSGTRARGSTSRCSSTPPIRRSSGSRSIQHNERWLELALFADRRYQAGAPALRRAARRARPDVQEASKNAPVHRAPTGLEANDLSRRLLEVARRRIRTSTRRWARCSTTYGRQPRAAHDFPREIPEDRILFGKDSVRARTSIPTTGASSRRSDEVLRLLPRLPRVLEAVGLDLPDDVLKKLYYKNAVRLVPGIPKI